MLRKLVIATLLLSSPAFACEPMAEAEKVFAGFPTLSVTKEEYPQVSNYFFNKSFEEVDLDNDGKLTSDEYNQYSEQRNASCQRKMHGH